jgi:hypothetical protein
MTARARCRTASSTHHSEDIVRIAVQVEPEVESPPDVEYRWDCDTDILSARLSTAAAVEGTPGSVEVAGEDGSWLILDLTAGRINGVEVAVWPDVRKRPTLEPPAASQAGHAVVRAAMPDGTVPALEMSTAVMAEADAAERTIHFRLGGERRTRTLRLGRDLLLDLDAQSRLAGVWLLNVPPCPDA